MLITERNERFLNFFTPALLVAFGLFLMNAVVMPLLLVNTLLPILSSDATIAAIQMNLFSQIGSIVIVLIFLIPFFKVKKVPYRGITIKRLIIIVGFACTAMTIAFFLALAFLLLFTALGIPIQHSYEFLLLKPEHLANPWNIVLFFCTVTLGAAIFEELIFRRMLIPLLEMRGMAPMAAVITSALGFALIHTPNDIMNGSLGYVITHLATTFTLGVLLGLAYIVTRNVIFPIFIHGFINFVAFTEVLIEATGDFNLLILYAFAILAIWIIGLVVGAILLTLFLMQPRKAWTETIRESSKINALPGMAGYTVLVFGLVSLQVIIETILLLVFFPNSLLVYGSLFLVYLLLLGLLIWIITETSYEARPELEPKLVQT